MTKIEQKSIYMHFTTVKYFFTFTKFPKKVSSHFNQLVDHTDSKVTDYHEP